MKSPANSRAFFVLIYRKNIYNYSLSLTRENL